MPYAVRVRRPLGIAVLTMGLVGYARAQPAAALPGAGVIRVIQASYGDNLNPALAGNATRDAAMICDGQQICWYKVTTSRLGDPVYGQQKGFSVKWTCGDRYVRAAYAIPEAGNGSTLGLSCGVALGPNPPSPFTITECEGSGGCGTWRFLGKQGQGVWPDGAVADLTITRLEGKSMTIWRTDQTGTARGMTAVYHGVINDHGVLGTVTWTWPGHWNNQPEHGSWKVTPRGSSSGAETSQLTSDDKKLLGGIITFGAAMIGGEMEQQDQDDIDSAHCVESGGSYDRSSQHCHP